MLIVRIHSGLGNQLFQYAMGRCLSLKMNTELLLDLSFYDNELYKANKYFENPEWHFKCNLLKYNINGSVASKNDLDLFQLGRCSRVYRNLSKWFGSDGLVWSSNSYATQKPFGKVDFKNAVRKDKLYLNGYWGSEQYFIDIKDSIIEELTLNDTHINQAEPSVIDAISNENSVSVHFRRGAYLGSSYWNNLSLDYYRKSINYIKERVANPTFILFSDDIQWVKDNVGIDENHVFIENVSPDFMDLHYMSLCKHNIIANSTFSWWGAYLNKNPNKIVVAPTNWFDEVKAQKAYIEQSSLPTGWVRI